MSGINRKKCCCGCGCANLTRFFGGPCVHCGVCTPALARVTVSGWTPGCCIREIQSEQPTATLAGTWTMQHINATCLWRFTTTTSPWTWNNYNNTACAVGTPSTSTPQARFELRWMPAADTGIGADHWTFEMMNFTTTSRVFRGHIVAAANDCPSTFVFTNNGTYSGGALLTACGTGGTATVEMCV